MTSQEQQPVTETAIHMAQQAGDKIDQAVDMAKQRTSSRLDTEREHIADSLYTTAHALRQVSQQLREQEQAPIATMADRMAQQAERTSGYLRGRNLSEIIDDTEQLGRAHPLLFAGGALGLGLLGVRFLKSSRRQQQPDVTALPSVTSTPTASLPPVAIDAAYGTHDTAATSPVANDYPAMRSTGDLQELDAIDSEDMTEETPNTYGVMSGS